MNIRVDSYNIVLINSFENSSDSPIICLDVEALGGVDKTIDWITSKWRTGHDRQAVTLIAAAGRKGGIEDLSKLGRLVDGIIIAPIQNDAGSWSESLRSMIIGLQNPKYCDVLDHQETVGAISIEEFNQRYHLDWKA